MAALALSELQKLSRAHGLELFGALDAEQAQKSLRASQTFLEDWQAAGHAGSMGYMQRPATLFTGLDNFLPDCRSVVSFVVSYLQPNPRGEGASIHVPPAPYGAGRV